MSLLEADPYLSYTPSMIGCGAVALARLILDYENIWPKEMSDLTTYCLNDLIPILKHLNTTYKGAPHTQQSAIRMKYKSTRYISVDSKLRPLTRQMIFIIYFIIIFFLSF